MARRTHRAPDPGTFLATGGRGDRGTVVVCAGDSLTEGIVSADWTSQLQTSLPDGYQVVNAGVGGDLAWNLLQRLDVIVACRPDVVVVLVGSNDVAAGIDQGWLELFRRAKEVPVEPRPSWYRQCLSDIVGRLLDETPARIALVELPMLGEDLDSATNRRVVAYNRVVGEVARARGVAVLGLHGVLVAALPAGHRPPGIDEWARASTRARVARRLLRRSWDRIARLNGLVMLTDHLHLGDRAGRLLADLVRSFVLAEPSLPTSD